MQMDHCVFSFRSRMEGQFVEGKVVFTIYSDKKHLNSVKVPIVPIDRKDNIFHYLSNDGACYVCMYVFQRFVVRIRFALSSAKMTMSSLI